jgi:Ca2+-binding RTX toxin-like protein
MQHIHDASRPSARTGRFTKAGPLKRPRALTLVALGGALLAATLSFGTGVAHAAYSAHVRAGTLEIDGNAASDKLSLRLAPGAPNILQLDVGEDGSADFSFDRSTFTAIAADAGRGDDEIRIDQSGGPFTDEAIMLNGGDGNDTLIGGSGAETFFGGKGDDFVDGNIGADTAFLGSGDDRFRWDPGDGSDTVEGDAGQDELDFNGSNAAEQIELAPNGARARLTRNVAAITMDLDTLEHVSLSTLGGADIVTADDLAGTDVKTFDVDLQAITGTGDGSADSVVVRGTNSADSLKLVNVGDREAVDGLATQTRVSGDEAADAIRVEGLNGSDTFTSSVAVHGQIPVHFTGGDGQDTAAYNGSDQADEIGIARDATEAAVFATGAATTLVDPTVESLIVSGLDGNDTIAGQNGLATITALTLQGDDGDDDLRGGDGADTLNGGKGDDHADGNIGADTAFLGTGDDHFQWDPGDGSDTVEGQAGNDTLDFNGSNAAEQIELTANGNRLRLTRNVANITMDTDSTEHVNIRTLGSADTTTIGNLAGTDVNSVDVDLRAAGGTGDGAADTVVTQGSARRDVVAVTQAGAEVTVAGFAAETHIIGSEPTLDTLRVETLAGDDDVTVAPDVPDVVATLVDLGTDE